MLRGTQASDRLLLDMLVETHYLELCRLAYSILDDREAAKAAAETALVEAVQRRHLYQKRGDVRCFLFSLCIKACRRYLPGIRMRRGFNALVSREYSGTGPSPRDQVEAELWLAVEAQGGRQSLPILLYYLHNFTVHEIAELLGTSEPRVGSRLQAAEVSLYEILADVPGDEADRKTIIFESLARRWGDFDLEHSEVEQIKDLLFSLYKQQKQNQNTRGRFAQAALVSLSFVLVAVILWITNQTASRETNPLAARTVIVTKIVKVSVYITPTPMSEAVMPLTQDSLAGEVRQRILESRESWDSLWVEAQVISHGPSGYVGPPMIRREQAWLSQPADSLVVSGPTDGVVEIIWLETDSAVYTLDELGRSYETDSHRNMLQGPAISSSMIFNPNALIDSEESIEIVGSTNTIGRDTLIVDILSGQGRAKNRVWVDSKSGIILGLRSFDEDGLTVLSEINITRIEFNQPFPRSIFDKDLKIRQFMEDYRALAVGEPWQVEAAHRPSADGHVPFPQSRPPAGFDPSRSNLELQWSQSPPVELQEMKMVPVEIYASGYYLGQVPVGNPWNAICERSPDGRSLAIVEVPDFPPFPSQRMRWLYLNNLSDLNEPLPDGSRYGNDFAFSPDSRSLVFWGCSVRDDNCGVYILNLGTSKLRKILPGRYAGNFIWNPDGKQLAMFRSDGFLLVADVDTGEITYKNAIDWTDLVIPSDAPLHGWDITFPPEQNGLLGCEKPGV